MSLRYQISLADNTENPTKGTLETDNRGHAIQIMTSLATITGQFVSIHDTEIDDTIATSED